MIAGREQRVRRRRPGRSRPGVRPQRRPGSPLPAALLLLGLCSGAAARELAHLDPVPGPDDIVERRPNLVLILADDLGFSDLGSYGSEIRTPHLDALAHQGVRLANYHTAASCAPTRAMLMTGLDSHRAGVGNMPESLPPEQRGQPGYEGHLRRDVVTVAERLRAAGYRTAMTGKWHLGKAPDQLPSARGFAYTFALADTGADNWEQKPYLPVYARANWFENGEPATLPDDFYSSRTLVDRLIGFLDADGGSGGDGQEPFFAYLAFQAVHIPVQAPAEFRDRYDGAYAEGWEVLRQRRYEGAVAAGVAAPGLEPRTMATTVPWDELDPQAQRYQARTMAVYAGMIEAMDHHVGRLVAHLDATGRLDDTVFVFLSDNGPEPSDPRALEQPFLRWTFDRWLAASDYSTAYETLGERGSYVAIGPSTASAAASPFAWYKFFTGEGGLRVPAIVSGFDTPLAGEVVHAFTWVTDVTPTLLALAGVRPDDPAQPPGPAPEGRSLLPLLTGSGPAPHGRDEPIGYELGGNSALFRGNFKLVRNRQPLGDGIWHLYDLATDPAETRDLRATRPELLASLLADYEAYVARNGVLPVPEGYDQRLELVRYGLRERFGHVLPALRLFLAAFLLALALWVVQRTRRRVRRNGGAAGPA